MARDIVAARCWWEGEPREAVVEGEDKNALTTVGEGQTVAVSSVWAGIVSRG